MAPKVNLSKRGNVWWYSFSLNGEQHRQSTGIKAGTPQDRAKALLVAEKVLRQLERGKSLFMPEQETASALFEKYIARKVSDGLNPSTERNYRNYVGKFFQFFPEDVKLSLIGSDDMEEWKAFLLNMPCNAWFKAETMPAHLFTPKHKGKVTPKYAARKARESLNKPSTEKTLSKKTVKECLVFVAGVCNHFGLSNPLKNVKLPERTAIEKQERLNTQLYNAEEIGLLLKTAKEHNRELFWWLLFIISTGCRIGEAQGIRCKDINWEDSTVFLISGKRDIGRTVNLEPMRSFERTDADGVIIEDGIETGAEESPMFALSVLAKLARDFHGRDLLPDDTLYFRYDNWIYKRLEVLSRMAGLRRLSPHGLRHSFVTLAMAQGHDLAAIAKVAGHKNIQTTYATYGHLSKDVKITLKLR